MLSDQSTDNSESDDSSDELPDLEDSDRDSEYSDVDSEYSGDSDDFEDSDEEELGPGFNNFMHLFLNAMAPGMFGKLNFTGCLKSNLVFYRVCRTFDEDTSILRLLQLE